MTVLHAIKIAKDEEYENQDQNKGWRRFQEGLGVLERAAILCSGLGVDGSPQIPPLATGSTVLVLRGELAGSCVIRERERVLVVTGTSAQRDRILETLSVKDNPYVLHNEEIVAE